MSASGQSLNDCSRSPRASVAPIRSRNTPTKSRRCGRSCSAPIRWSSTARASRARIRLAPGRVADQLLPRLAENERILVEVCDLLTAAVAANRRIAPAAEWLLKNFSHAYRRADPHGPPHLPKGYSRELPRLAQGPSARLPRVYDLAFENDLAWRRQGRRGDSFPFRGRLPDGDAAQAGRIVGHTHHAAPGTDRKSAPGRSPDSGRHDRPQPGRRLGEPDDGDRRKRPQEPDSGDCGHGALEPADGGLVCRRVGAPVAGTQRRAGLAAHLDRAAAFGIGFLDRAVGAIGDAGAGRASGSRSATRSAVFAFWGRWTGAISWKR